MNGPEKTTKVKAFIDACQNNPLLSVIIIVGVVVIAFSQFTEAIDKIHKFFNPDHPPILAGPGAQPGSEALFKTGSNLAVEILFSLAEREDSPSEYLRAATSICNEAVKAYTETGKQTAVAGALVIPHPPAIPGTKPSCALSLEKTSLGEMPEILRDLTPASVDVYSLGDEPGKSKPLANLLPTMTEHTLFCDTESEQLRIEVSIHCVIKAGRKELLSLSNFQGAVLIRYKAVPEAFEGQIPLATVQSLDLRWPLVPRGLETLTTTQWKNYGDASAKLFYGFFDIPFRPSH